MKKIILYGGAFNPPHIGHAVAIDTAMRLFKADELWIAPSADRKDKKITVSGEHRIKMLKITVKELFSKPTLPIKISAIDLEIGAPTFTYKTLHVLAEKFPKNNFYFLMGSENIDNIKKFWIKGHELLKIAKFIAIKKPGSITPNKLPKSITLLEKDVAWIDMSSTLVRKLLPSGHSGLPYITKGVSKYIKKHRLYR